MIETETWTGEPLFLMPRAHSYWLKAGIYLDVKLAPGGPISLVHSSREYWTVYPWCDWEWIA